MELLYRNLARTRDEWVLGEIEQMLFTADQQLQLAGNLHGALNALQAADQILQRQQRPAMIPLRRALGRRHRHPAQPPAARSGRQRGTRSMRSSARSTSGRCVTSSGLQAERHSAPAAPATGLAALWADLRSLVARPVQRQPGPGRDIPGRRRPAARERPPAADRGALGMIRGDEAQVSRRAGRDRRLGHSATSTSAIPAVRRALQQIGQLRAGHRGSGGATHRATASRRCGRPARAFERQG
jgi:hypothetical protein